MFSEISESACVDSIEIVLMFISKFLTCLPKGFSGKNLDTFFKSFLLLILVPFSKFLTFPLDK